jgi:hypothetical protein
LISARQRARILEDWQTGPHLVIRNYADPDKGTESIIQDLTRPESLFHHLFEGDRGYLVVCYEDRDLPPDEQWKQESFRYPGEMESAAAFVIDHAQLGQNTYFCVHLLTQRRTRKGRYALRTVRALWLDEDEGHYPDDGPKATAIIFSSRTRRHLYWRLARPVPIDWAVALNKRIATWANGDTGKYAKASVLRPAGTANFKREKPDLVGGYLTGVEAWEPEVMDQAIPPLASPEPEQAPRGPYTGADIALAPYLESVEVIRERSDSKGRCFEIVCPWSSEHSHGDKSGTRIGKYANGWPWFWCEHETCRRAGRSNWQAFKRKVRPVYRRPRHTDKPGYTGPKVREFYRE